MPDRSGLRDLGTPVGLAVGPQGMVATGSEGVAWSADGVAWQPVDRGPVGVPVVATTGGFFALGDGSGWTSADGRSWTAVEAREAGGFHVHGIVAVGSTLVAAGTLEPRATDTNWSAVFTSTDGWTWRREVGVFPPFERLAVSGGIVIGTARTRDERGNASARAVAVRRADGTWTAPTPAAPDADVAAVAGRPLGGFVALGTSTSASDPATKVWSSADGIAWAPLPGASSIEGTVVGIVATTDGLVVATHDPTAFWRSADGGAWTRSSDMPSFDAGLPVLLAVAGDRLMALGEALDPTAPALAWTSPPAVPEAPPATGPMGTWASAGRLPVRADGDRLVALLDGSLLLLGGTSRELDPLYGLRYLADVWRRDASGHWSARTPMPRPRVAFTSVVAIDGRVWVLGGGVVGMDAPVRIVDIYDPAADRWSSGPQLPQDACGSDAVAMPDGSIVAICWGSLWRASARDTAWRKVATMSQDVAGLSSALLPDGSVLVLHSATVAEPDPAAPGATRERLVLSAVSVDPVTGAARPRHAPSGSGVTSGTLVRLGDGRVALALEERGDPAMPAPVLLRRVDVYDAVTDTWTELTRMPAGRQGAGVAVDASGRLWIAGGETSVVTDTILIPSDELLVWTPPAPRPGGP